MPCETDLIILKLLFNDDKVRSIQALIINGNPAFFLYYLFKPLLPHLPTNQPINNYNVFESL